MAVDAALSLPDRDSDVPPLANPHPGPGIGLFNVTAQADDVRIGN